MNLGIFTTLYTLDEYFALEKASERRFEYWDGEIVCMSGGSKEHGLIQSNLSILLGNRLQPPCRPFGSDLAVKTSTSSGYLYPDGTVACSPQYERHPLGIDMLTNPLLIIEVTSPTSGIRDHNRKRDLYQSIESLRDYIIIEPDSVYITHYHRSSVGWKKRIYDDTEDAIELSDLGVSLILSEIYRDVVIEQSVSNSSE